MGQDKNLSIWNRESASRNARLATDIKADIAVIGAGYTGLSAAYHIKKLKPDEDVVVLESEFAGHGASGRNGGMCLNQAEMDYMSVARPETHKLTYEATAQCIREISALMTAHGYGSSIRHSGSLQVNMSDKGAERARRYLEMASSAGVPIEYWDRERVAKEIGTRVYSAGLYDPNAADVEPMKLVRALKKAAEGAGAVIYENSPVVRISEGEPVRLTVEGADGVDKTVTAKSIVLATDAYSSRLHYFRSRVGIVHTEMAATKVLPKDTLSKIGWTSRIPFHDDRLYLYHLSTTDDGRITIGAGNAEYFFNEPMFYKKSLEIRREALRRELVRIYPALKDVEMEHIWSGALGYPYDNAQSVGVTGRKKNIFYGIGYAGHGVTLSFLFGKVIADIHGGRAEAWKRMPFFQRNLPAYIPPEPFRYIAIKNRMASMKRHDKKSVE
jgi:gamma-glutamylputrescine oxidase